MSTARDAARPRFRLGPLAAGLALALAASDASAVTQVRPGAMPGPHALREDGTPLRTALMAWHQDALQNAAPPPGATTDRVVTTCADDGAGSLREAIASSASGDTIDLGALFCSRITLETGALAVRVDSLNVIGPPSGDFVIDGRHLDRVFLHYGSGGFLLRDVTVSNGHNRATGTDLGIGGCIASAGYLTLDHSVVTGCYAGGEGGYGGAVYAYSLIMSASTLSDNVAYGVHPTNGTAAFGGAAFVYQLDMVDSTVSGNSARHHGHPRLGSYDIGGGISTIHGGLVIDSTIDSNYAYGIGGGLATFDDILLRNSTISGNNTRKGGGGGLFIRYPALLDARNSTIAANSSHDGGGILFSSTTASLQSTIVSGNDADQHDHADISGARALVADGANNLVGRVSTNIVLPGDTLRGNPALLPLGHNGGPTRTHALAPGSVAIDAGNNLSNLSSDQRGPGYARVVGAAADIGAFELGATAADAIADPVPALSTWTTLFLAAIIALGGMCAARARRNGA